MICLLSIHFLGAQTLLSYCPQNHTWTNCWKTTKIKHLEAQAIMTTSQLPTLRVMFDTFNTDIVLSIVAPRFSQLGNQQQQQVADAKIPRETAHPCAGETCAKLPDCTKVTDPAKRIIPTLLSTRVQNQQLCQQSQLHMQLPGHSEQFNSLSISPT